MTTFPTESIKEMVMTPLIQPPEEEWRLADLSENRKPRLNEREFVQTTDHAFSRASNSQ